MIYASPLVWPAPWPRAASREFARFAVAPPAIRRDLDDELRRMGGTQAMLSTNMELSRIGEPYAKQRGISDPGAALYFVLDGKDMAIPCDKWTDVWDNIRAISKTIEALRGIERWGAKSMMEAAFAGFAALPAGETTGSAWWEVLGVSAGDPWEVITAAYLRRTKETHPDITGGDSRAFLAVQDAYKSAEAARRLVA